MQNQAITIGLPFLNAETTLVDAIRSVFAQTFENWELLLVDDGSCDRSLEIARAVRDPRVTVVSDGENRGLSNRLNQIAQLAGNNWLARMDADDMMHPQRLMRQAEFLDGNPGIDVLGTLAYVVDAKNYVLGKCGFTRFPPTGEDIARNRVFVHPTVTGRTEWFRKNPYSESFLRPQDRELWARTGPSSHFGALPVPLLFYRANTPTLLQRHLASFKDDIVILRAYGPSLVGRRRSERLEWELCIKSIAVRTACKLGLGGRLARRSYSPVTRTEVGIADEAIRTITSAHVPGLTCRCSSVSGELPSR